ncbi:ATP-binding cassette, subfamily G (WHITE), member 2, PDR [Cryptococcus neoformans A2-102-5]|nr:ATP-binding cassette, subfamily G (WHITE), member 2, PDR [Cryptococcus neoformans var. grubii D17-1]OXG91776.1 ATP-binding cassette, subfamily G (WHITE), member 2, PDR [Cryptococcus neoformans var. grubii A2-102-5]
MLKTIAGEMNGIVIDESSEVNYRGISPKQMYGQFRGEPIYTGEADVHFLNLTVEQTLSEKGKVEIKAEYAEFAAPLWKQFTIVVWYVWQQHWRTRSYIWGKAAFCIGSSGTSQQGLQNQLFTVFMPFTIFGQLVQQMLPNFLTQRSLYEVRERPSKTYSWKVFIMSNVIAEIPWSTSIYYPIGYYRNAIPTDSVHLRVDLMFLYIEMFMLFTSTFAIMIVAGIDTAETAGNIANLLFLMCHIFWGVLATKESFPPFWIFRYRISPFTYLVEGMLSVAIANTNIVCANNELLSFNPSSAQTCGQYMSNYIAAAGGYLINEDATTGCSFYTMSDTNAFLAQFDNYSHKGGADMHSHFQMERLRSSLDLCTLQLNWWMFHPPLIIDITSGASYLDCFKGVNLRRTEIVCMLWATQNLAGNTFSNYFTYFFEQVGLSGQIPYDSTMGQYAINMHVASLVTDALMLVWTVFYQCSVETLAFSLVAEMSTRRLEIKTVALGRAAYNIAAIISNVLTPYMINPTAWNWGNYTGFFWGGSCFLVLVYAYFRVPELFDRTFAELDILFE